MSDEIVWEEPPKSGRGVPKVARFIEALQSRPGVWALYPTTFKNASSPCSLRADLKRAGCEATARTQPDGTARLYARWVGES